MIMGCKSTVRGPISRPLAKFLSYLTVILLIGCIFFAASGESEVNCAGLSQWSATHPPVNQQHVFCGEWNKRKNRPAGFHARPGGDTPAPVGALKMSQQPNTQGLYGVRWSYTGHSGREKFSSMFPDTCTDDQILKSIVYAATHPKPCPDGAPRWAKCGANKPAGGVNGYCEAWDQTLFTIAFATLKNNGNVNTAFPIVEK
jgi:hypothetical protein